MKTLLTILLLLFAFGPSAGFAQTRPNILFIAVDDLRPSMGCYGDAVAITPNMDRLAGSGLLFNQAYCQVAVCNPSRASLMTGQRPDKLGVWTLPVHFREAQPDAVTLPQWFREFGYTAVSHGKIYHNPTPDPQSWSEPIRSLPKLPNPYPAGTAAIVDAAKEELPEKDWRKSSLRRPSTAAPDLPDNKVLDGARTDMAIEDLRRLGKQDEPFFLAMGYIRPHLAWVAPKQYWDMHDPAKLPVVEEPRITEDTPKFALHNNSELSHYVDLVDMPKPWDDRALSLQKARHLVHGYYACVSYVDAQIGRLLDALEKEGLADNTIVVLWSDHGWKLGEYRGWGKMTNYEIDARVPMIISAPGMKDQFPTGGQRTDQLAELLDLFPTLCEMAQIDTPDFVDGKSLVPVLRDANAEVHKHSVSQYYRKVDKNEVMGYSIRTMTHRMIEWREFKTGELVVRELYDHQTDHSETENLIGTASEELVEVLSELLATTHPPVPLEMVPQIHSEPSETKGKISFKNESDADLLIKKVDKRGRRAKRPKKVSPGDTLNINGSVGVVYVVESSDGAVQEFHSISEEGTKVVIQ